MASTWDLLEPLDLRPGSGILSFNEGWIVQLQTQKCWKFWPISRLLLLNMASLWATLFSPKTGPYSVMLRVFCMRKMRWVFRWMWWALQHESCSILSVRENSKILKTHVLPWWKPRDPRTSLLGLAFPWQFWDTPVEYLLSVTHPGCLTVCERWDLDSDLKETQCVHKTVLADGVREGRRSSPVQRIRQINLTKESWYPWMLADRLGLGLTPAWK